MNSIIIVKGISGSGKSSRVFQLIKYFESLGATLEDFKYVNVEGKERVVGLLVKELNLLFIGKMYNSGDIQRWQGYDAVTGAFKKAAYFSEFIKENISKYTIFVEGAGITQTHRLRPFFLFDEIGVKEIMIQYYNYPIEGKDEYLNRIIYRSGEKPKKDVMWNKNLGFINDYNFSIKECDKLNNPDSVFVFKGEFDLPIYDLGAKVLAYLGLAEEVDQFTKFVEEFDYINKNRFENFQ